MKAKRILKSVYIDVLLRQILFEEDRMNVILPEVDFKITCQAQNP